MAARVLLFRRELRRTAVAVRHEEQRVVAKATVTLALTQSSVRMGRRNALVKHILSVETLGSTTVICTDKTGTLTLNKLHVESLYLDFSEVGSEDSAGYEQLAAAHPATEIMALCNDVIAVSNDHKEHNGFHGDPTELALAEADVGSVARVIHAVTDVHAVYGARGAVVGIEVDAVTLREAEGAVDLALAVFFLAHVFVTDAQFVAEFVGVALVATLMIFTLFNDLF